jgi:hypothetical protein
VIFTEKNVLERSFRSSKGLSLSTLSMTATFQLGVIALEVAGKIEAYFEEVIRREEASGDKNVTSKLSIL